MNDSRWTRRRFLSTAASTALAARSMAAQDTASASRVSGANTRLRIGIIGCGNRANLTHLPTINRHKSRVDHSVVTIADPWRLAREKTAARVRELYDSRPKQYGSYRELLQMKDLDAVMIASPDHVHTLHLEAAARAGKHIYCEKPMGIDLASTVRAFDAAKAAGTVVQIGTQQRSIPGSVGARDFYRTGMLGKVSRIEEVRNAEKPYWYKHLRDVDIVKAKDLDWEEFMGGLPPQPFDPRKFAAWYGYYEFSQGPIPQWGVHFIDLAHFITGCGFPESCVCMADTYVWKDENQFTAPDQAQAVWTYPEGFMLSFTSNLGNGFGNGRKIYGDKGLLNLDNWNYPTYSAEGGARRDGSMRGVNKVERPDDYPDHFRNWLECMAEGDVNVAAPPEAGLQHAVASIMAIRSFETGKRTRWDRQKREIVYG